MADEKTNNIGGVGHKSSEYKPQTEPQNESQNLGHSPSQKSFQPSVRLEVPSDEDAKVFQLAYSVNDTPAWYLTIVLAFQVGDRICNSLEISVNASLLQ